MYKRIKCVPLHGMPRQRTVGLRCRAMAQDTAELKWKQEYKTVQSILLFFTCLGFSSSTPVTAYCAILFTFYTLHFHLFVQFWHILPLCSNFIYNFSVLRLWETGFVHYFCYCLQNSVLFCPYAFLYSKHTTIAICMIVFVLFAYCGVCMRLHTNEIYLYGKKHTWLQWCVCNEICVYRKIILFILYSSIT